jgi:hypothetical protein
MHKKIIDLYYIGFQQKLYIRYLMIFLIITNLAFPFVPLTFYFDSIRGGIALLILGVFFNKKRYYNAPARLIIWFTLLVLLMAFVNFINQSFLDIVSLKILMTSLFFVVGYNLVKTQIHFLYLLRTFYWGLIIVIVAVALFNLLGVESKAVYGSDVAVFGPQGTNLTKSLPLLLFPTLLLLNFNISKKQKSIIYLLFILAIVLILLGQKRGTMLSFSLGFLVYLYFNPFRKKKFNIIAVSVFVLLISAPFYWGNVEQVYLSRQERYSLVTEGNVEALETEARYWEIIAVTDDLQNRNIVEIIFGIGFGSWEKYWGTDRMLHTDYMMFLNDTGIAGLFLYIFIYYKITIISWKLKNVLIRKNQFAINLFGMIVVIILVAIVQAISGLSHGTNLRAYVMLFLGGAMGYLEYQYVSAINNLQSCTNE